MNKQLKSKQKHKILNVKNHKIFNYSKLTIVQEWLLKQRMAQMVECLVILHIERGFSEKCFSQPMKFLNFLILPCKKLANQNGFLQNVNTSVRSTKDPDPPGSQQDFCSLHCFCK